MSLKEEVCSLEYAKRLKELGVVVPDSPFQWVETPSTYAIYPATLVKTITSTEVKLVFGKYATLEGGVIDSWTAFTAGQLFEILPAHIETQVNIPFNNYYFKLQKRNAKNIQYIINYQCDTYRFDDVSERLLFEHNIYDEKLADCLAKLLIQMKESCFL